MSRAAAPKKGGNVIFNAAEVAAHLVERKAMAADAAWWTDVITIDWHDVRKPAGSATHWLSVHYTDRSGVKGRLVIRIKAEAHSGQIMPRSDAGMARLMARIKPNPQVQYKIRDKKPALQIRKWSTQVKTAEDGVTPAVDENGEPIVPDDKYLSHYYQIASLLGEVFVTEAEERIDRGKAFVSHLQAGKKAAKSATAEALLSSFVAENGASRPGGTIITNDDAVTIRKLFPAPKDYESLTRGLTVVPNARVAPLVQENLSQANSRNPGAPLPNPIARIALNFDPKTHLPLRLSFFDKSKPYSAEGKRAYEAGMVDGEPVNDDNVHEFILPRCRVDGIVNADSVCFSQMGISIPVKLEVAVVDPPVTREVTLDDVYGDDDDLEGSGPSSGPAPPPPVSTSVAPGPPSPATPHETPGDLADVLADIGLGGANGR